MSLLTSGLAIPLQAQAAEHTLGSVFEAAVAWGYAAKSYKKRQWSKSRDELLDSLAGSTIAFTAQLNTRDITISDGFARYEAALPIGPSYTDDLAEWELQDLAPRWKEATLMETVAFRFTTITYFVVRLTDTSKQFATALPGTITIRGAGRIAEVSVADSQVSISIDITSWHPASGPNWTEP